VLAFAAHLIHGYHPQIEDAEIYLPAIKQHLNPALYRFGAEFFQSHAGLTMFDEIVAVSARLSHLSFDTVIFIWQFSALVLLLIAGWKLNRTCFGTEPACWGGVALLAALLTFPVSGTSLLLFDQYLTPRSISAFTTLFAIGGVLARRHRAAALWVAVTAVFHPLMALFTLCFVSLLFVFTRVSPIASGALAGLSAPLWAGPASDAYHEVVLTRSYFFILKWTWYDWAGLVVTVGLLWWFRQIAVRQHRDRLALLCGTLLAWIAMCSGVALVLTVPARFETLARYQPMRGLHLAFMVAILAGGGFLAETVLRRRPWRWLAVFVPLCTGMWCGQRVVLPATPHVEWPGTAPRNAWVEAFLWIRGNTPVDAVFALDPDHMALPGEDQHGFRLIAERSRLADAVKDSGAATMFPYRPLPEHWREQVRAQTGWKSFTTADFDRLHRTYGVTWVVLERPPIAGLDCRYQNDVLAVCRVGR
jgi:hypothetical protein